MHTTQSDPATITREHVWEPTGEVIACTGRSCTGRSCSACGCELDEMLTRTVAS